MAEVSDVVRCWYCKRVLKDPVSIARKAGPSCAEQHGVVTSVGILDYRLPTSRPKKVIIDPMQMNLFTEESEVES